MYLRTKTKFLGKNSQKSPNKTVTQTDRRVRMHCHAAW